MTDCVSGWLKADGGGGDRFNTVLGFGDCCPGGPGRDAIEFGAEHKSPNRTIISIDARNSGDPPAETSQLEGFVNGPAVNRWVHLAYVRENDGTTSAYVHSPAAGGLELSATNSVVTGLLAPEGDGSDPNNMNRINIGRTPFAGGDRAASGLIGDVQFYHQALTEAEVTQLYDNLGTSIGGGGGTPPDTFSWRIDTAGNWTSASNWTPTQGLPNANNHTAIFGDAIVSRRTVFSDTDVTVKSVQFDNANSYAIAGGGTVNLDAGTSGNASISVAGTSGTHEFQARVALATDTDVDIATGTTLEFNNRLNLGDNTLTKIGGGDMAINNILITGGGTVQLSAGSITGEGTIEGDMHVAGGTVSPGATAVPEPSSLVLVGLGLLFFARRRVAGGTCRSAPCLA